MNDCKWKCILKWVGIVVAIAGAAATAYYFVSKYIKNKVAEADDDDYYSCIEFDDETEEVEDTLENGAE